MLSIVGDHFTKRYWVKEDLLLSMGEVVLLQENQGVRLVQTRTTWFLKFGARIPISGRI